MKQILLGLLLLANGFLQAQQNLVPNPSFEIYSTCPAGHSQLNLVTDWQNPTGGTPDYFNACSQFVGVPNNPDGFQYAKEGNAYIGIYCREDPFVDEREYVSVKLINSLKKDQFYKATFYVSFSNGAKYSCNQMGLYFSNQLLSGINYEPLSLYNPQIENPTAIQLNDTLNWVAITGNYRAIGNEEYITLGNFYDDSNTWFAYAQPGAAITYYYIDDVSVVACDTCERDTSKTNNLFIPDAFSPNGDGNNDLLFVRGNNFQELYFAVYDRWGEKVFETVDKSKGWDGTYQGKELNSGVFVYYCTGKYTDGKEFKAKGDITLVR